MLEASQLKERAPPVPAAATPIGPRGWRAIAVLLVLYAFAFLDRQMVTLLVTPIKHDLGLTDVQISLLQGIAFVAFYVLFAFPVGWAVDRFPRRRIIFWGVFIWSLAAACTGLARSYIQLLLARFAVGAGEAALSPGSYSLLSDLVPKQRLAGAMAIFSTGAIVGGAISLFAGGLIAGLAAHGASYVLPIVGEVRAWQLVFLLTGAPGVVMSFLVFTLYEPARPAAAPSADAAHDATDKNAVEKSGAAGAFAHVWRYRGFYLSHFAAFSCLNVMTGGWTAWAPTFLVRSYDWPISRAGMTLGVIVLICGTAGMLFSGFFVDFLFRRGRRDAHMHYFVWATLVLGIAGIVAGSAPAPVRALAGAAVISLIAPFIAVAASALQVATPPRFRGQVSSMFLICYNIVGFGAGPTLVASITDLVFHNEQKLGPALAVTFALLTPITMLFFWLGRRPMIRAAHDLDLHG